MGSAGDLDRGGDGHPGLAPADAAAADRGGVAVVEADRHPHLADEIALLEECLARNVPALGICLGAQLLARALDRAVPPSPVREVGFEPVRPTAAAARNS